MEVSVPDEKHEEMPYAGGYIVCKKCGLVKPLLGWSKRPCRGKVKIALR
jgi:hypothetical protein